jgi:hypothetical protein
VLQGAPTLQINVFDIGNFAGLASPATAGLKLVTSGFDAPVFSKKA